MNRPLYESEQDLQREKQVIERITPQGVQAYKLPVHNHLDFAMVRDGAITGLVEVRCRNNEMRKYGTFFCNLSKVISARDMARYCKCPAYLFVQWTDRLGYIDLEEDFEVKYGGRNQMRDWQDKGLLAHFDIDLFTEWRK
jgi:hypothetical protein